MSIVRASALENHKPVETVFDEALTEVFSELNEARMRNFVIDNFGSDSLKAELGVQETGFEKHLNSLFDFDKST